MCFHTHWASVRWQVCEQCMLWVGVSSDFLSFLRKTSLCWVVMICRVLFRWKWKVSTPSTWAPLVYNGVLQSPLFLRSMIFSSVLSAFKQRLLSQRQNADCSGSNVPGIDSLCWASHKLYLFSPIYSWPFSHLSLLGFLSKDALVTAINNDIEEANVKLDHPEHLKLKEDNFFTSTPSFSSVTPPTTSSVSQTIMNGHWLLAFEHPRGL